MSWLGVLMFLGVGAILGGALVAWCITDTIRVVNARCDQLEAERQQIAEAVRKGYIDTLQRRMDGAR